MLAGDVTELRKAAEVIKVRPKVPIYEENYLDWTKDCAEFRTRRGYVQVRNVVSSYYVISVVIMDVHRNTHDTLRHFTFSISLSLGPNITYTHRHQGVNNRWYLHVLRYLLLILLL